jgi:hypothetical protein
LAELQASGKTLEQDQRGIKVTLLPDGRILKVFWLRGFFTSSRVYSNARSFCRNAQRLQLRGIATVSHCELFHFAGSTDTAVIYQPLAGQTVREMLKMSQFNELTAQKLGQFIAELHKKGIYFRSLHCGNIVSTPSGFGLIDIADLKIYLWQVWAKTCERNFDRLMRYQEDVSHLSQHGWQNVLMQAYLDAKKTN